MVLIAVAYSYGFPSCISPSFVLSNMSALPEISDNPQATRTQKELLVLQENTEKDSHGDTAFQTSNQENGDGEEDIQLPRGEFYLIHSTNPIFFLK